MSGPSVGSTERHGPRRTRESGGQLRERRPASWVEGLLSNYFRLTSARRLLHPSTSRRPVAGMLHGTADSRRARVSEKTVLSNVVGREHVDAADGRSMDLVDPTTGEVFGSAPLSG